MSYSTTLKLCLASFLCAGLTFVSQGAKKERINIENSDRILLIGGSFTSGGARDFRDKGFVSTVSQLVDWTVDGYGKSGDCYFDGSMAVLKNLKRYHEKIGPQDFNITKAISVYAENDGIYYNLMPAKYWRDNIVRYVKIMKSLGIQPVLGTQFGNCSRTLIYSILRDVAKTEKCDFLDIASKGTLFTGKRYLPFWNNGHPGMRTNSLLWYEVVKYINSLERPRQGIKIFRNRRSFKINNINDFLFDTIPERMKKWREISIGHRRSSDSTIRYYDALDKRKIRSFAEVSEYLKLMNKEKVPFEKYCLLQITFPATSSHIDTASIKIKSKDKLSAYVRKYIDDSLIIADKRNVGFRLKNPDATVKAGAVYSSDQANHKGVTFTAVKVSNGTLICVPSGKWGSKGLQSGILTNLSGGGPKKINFFGIFKAPGKQYLKNAFKPKGVLKRVAMNDNVLNLDKAFLKKHMDYDKLYVVLYNDGRSFNLEDIQIEWNGVRTKERNNFLSTADNGKNILKVTKFDDSSISKWKLPENVKAQVPVDGCMPKGITKIVELQPGQTMSQKIRIKTDKPVLGKIRCWARYLPPVFNPNAKFQLRANDPPGDNVINEDSYDFSSVTFMITRPLGAYNRVYEFDALVPLHWVEIEQEVYITSPKKGGVYTFAVKAGDRAIQLAFVSFEI